MLNSVINDEETTIPISEKHRTVGKYLHDTEIKTILEDEIRNATRELMEELKKAILVVKDEYNQIITEVLEEKKLIALSEKEKPIVQEIVKKTESTAQFRQGDRVKLILLDADLKPKDELTDKCLTYNGQVGNIVFISPYYVNGKNTFIYYVRIDKDKKTYQLTEDCLEAV